MEESLTWGLFKILSITPKTALQLNVAEQIATHLLASPKVKRQFLAIVQPGLAPARASFSGQQRRPTDNPLPTPFLTPALKHL